MSEPWKRDKVMPQRVIKVLRRIVPMCQDLTVDEQAWVTAACLRYLCMKIESSVTL
jgi:hypothetical protein